MTVILSERGEFDVPARDGLWLDGAEAERVAGWTLKPEGMCRDDVCVPVPPEIARDGRVDLAAFWRRLGNPVLHDEARTAWVLGTGAAERKAALAGDAAPDFELPDFGGVQRRLSALRGHKVFLVTWASW